MWALAFFMRSCSSREQPWGGVPCLGAGQCRPSFLIIGVGKCGTSSLYYYLTDHPKVKGASQKQIQWFDHQYSAARFKSYLQRFPKLEPGYMTGEASPGYAQYSEVPSRIFRHLPEVRILVIARDPAERAYSSYHYNYLSIARNPLSFETLVEKETALLERCLRKRPVDLSKSCYGATTAQEQVGRSDPHSNQHLWRQLVGRSLYAVYLDWWPDDSFHLVCSELLGDPTTAADEMNLVATYLGLPPFDFAPVVAKGKYNAGAKHLGYSHVTPWDQAARQTRPPMSDKARALIADFAHPHNLRLFDRAHRTCPYWGANARPALHTRGGANATTRSPTGFFSTFL